MIEALCVHVHVVIIYVCVFRASEQSHVHDERREARGETREEAENHTGRIPGQCQLHLFLYPLPTHTHRSCLQAAKGASFCLWFVTLHFKMVTNGTTYKQFSSMF